LHPEQIVHDDSEEARATLAATNGEALCAVGAEPRLEQELRDAKAEIAKLKEQLSR
jgi:hypothetical protein